MEFYFITKLFLYFGQYMGFHVFANLAFALFLAVPLQRPRLKLLRQIFAVPAGVALFYYDTWLPPFSRLISQASLLKGFDPIYMMELLGRFISLQVLATLALLYLLYFLAKKRLRVSTFVFIVILLPLLPIAGKSPNSGVTLASTAAEDGQPLSGSPQATTDNTPEPVTDAALTASLDSFYQNEATRTVSFAPPENPHAPFDIIFLHICSLSWDDLDFVRKKPSAVQTLRYRFHRLQLGSFL